jgi:ABC-type antimicrobial peptide transport system permease subunit
MKTSIGSLFGRFNPPLELHPGINYSDTPVGGDLGGLIFMIGSIAVVIIGLPFLGWFFGSALAGGVLLAGGLFWWHVRH